MHHQNCNKSATGLSILSTCLAPALFTGLSVLLSFHLTGHSPVYSGVLLTATPDTQSCTSPVCAIPEGAKPYIFYWGTFQCSLDYDTAGRRYVGAVRISVDALRSSVVTAPFLWDGKSLQKALQFDLDGWHVECQGSQATDASYLAYYHKMAAWAILAQPGDHFEVNNFTLPDGQQAVIDLQITDEAPQSPDEIPPGFLWGKTVWRMAAQYGAVSGKECFQLLHALPGYVQNAAANRYGHLAVYTDASEQSAADLYYYPAQADSTAAFAQQLRSLEAIVKPGARLVFEEMVNRDVQKTSVLNIVDRQDARWHAMGRVFTFVWGRLRQLLGPAPQTQWGRQQGRSPVILELTNNDLTPADILALLGQAPQMKEGNKEIPVRSMQVRYEEMAMSFTYSLENGFPEYFKSLLTQNLKPGDHVTLSFIEGRSANFADLRLTLIAQGGEGPK